MQHVRPSSRSAAFLLLAILGAGCASRPSEPAPAPRPHYKIGAPYEISGKRYVPREEPLYDAVGIASWYGDEFHGRPTANGEIFDKSRLSGAHTTLPLPSLVEVENLENGRRATIRVNDRGPFARDRIIDLSHAAAIELGFERAGLARVRVRNLGRADLHALAPTPREARAQTLAVRTPAPAPAGTPRGPAAEGRDPLSDAIVASETPAPAPAGRYWITVAEFASLEDMDVAGLPLAPGEEARIVSQPTRGALPLYAYEIGPFATMAQADARLAMLRDAGYPDAWISADRALAAAGAGRSR